MRGRMTSERIVAEAHALEANEVFTTEINKLRVEAIAGLIDTPAHDADTLRDHQAMVRAIDKLRAHVRLLALTNAPKSPSGLA